MDVRNYSLVTASYWGFTLTDGALRMLVLLHFHQLGYTPVHLAFLFLLYEFCGILTNLFGGWIGSRFGLRLTLYSGLAIQIGALIMLSFIQPDWAAWLSVTYAMLSQALSGIAKDLTKMSSKSAVKLLVNESPDSAEDGENQSRLFKWVAILTGSKNALKGVGIFLGGVLLAKIGFVYSLWAMAGGLGVILLASLIYLRADIGKSKAKVKLSQLFSKSREINLLSLSRIFLFGARDVWFVVGLPIFLATTLQWSHSAVGGFLAAWVIGYGIIQAAAPKFAKLKSSRVVDGARSARIWGIALVAVTAVIALALQFEFHPTIAILAGLTAFGFVFAINSSVHSYLILAYTDADQVALNVGFYYMANACGRLLGTLLSGLVYLAAGLPGCLWVSSVFVLAAAAITFYLPVDQAGNSSRPESQTVRTFPETGTKNQHS